MTADNCTFYNNYASSFGADIYGVSYESITVQNSMFSHSTSSINLRYSSFSARIENCTFSSFVTNASIVQVFEAKLLSKNITVKGYIGDVLYECKNTLQCTIESSTFQDVIAKNTVKFSFDTVPSLN